MVIGIKDAARSITNHIISNDLQSRLEFVRQSEEKEKIIQGFQEEIEAIIRGYCECCGYLKGLSK